MTRPGKQVQVTGGYRISGPSGTSQQDRRMYEAELRRAISAAIPQVSYGDGLDQDRSGKLTVRNIPFDITENDNWNTRPATIEDALNEIAARLRAMGG